MISSFLLVNWHQFWSKIDGSVRISKSQRILCFFSDEYLSLPPTRQGLTQSIFLVGSFREWWGRARTSTRALLDYVVHRLSGCNVSQMTLLGLGLTKCNVSPARMPDHSLNWTFRSSAMLSCQWLFVHSKVARSKLGTIWPLIYYCHCAPSGTNAIRPG